MVCVDGQKYTGSNVTLGGGVGGAGREQILWRMYVQVAILPLHTEFKAAHQVTFIFFFLLFGGFLLDMQITAIFPSILVYET